MILTPRTGKDIKVLLLDPLPAEAENDFIAAGYLVDEHFRDISEGELVKKIGEYQIVCVGREREDQILTEDVLRTAHRLLAIGLFGSLTNQIDLTTAQSMGIPVFTAPYQHQHSVAELVISYIVLLSRQIGDRSKECHTGTWNKISKNCNEVRGKTLGIVGYGHVGSQLGVLAEALSLRVLFYDLVALMPIGRAEPRDTLQQLLQESDYVALNVSCLPENDNMFGKQELAWMKKGSYLINVSYGKAVNHDALAEAITSGHLAGAAIDVFPETAQKGTIKSPLVGLSNVILTPTIGGDTREAHLREVKEVTSHIVRYILDGTTTGAVNFPNVAAWALKADSRRIICMHRNVRGVLKEIDNILSAYNVGKQVLDTKDQLGYLIADIATQSVTTEIVAQLAVLANCIRTRII